MFDMTEEDLRAMSQEHATVAGAIASALRGTPLMDGAEDLYQSATTLMLQNPELEAKRAETGISENQATTASVMHLIRMLARAQIELFKTYHKWFAGVTPRDNPVWHPLTQDLNRFVGAIASDISNVMDHLFTRLLEDDRWAGPEESKAQMVEMITQAKTDAEGLLK